MGGREFWQRGQSVGLPARGPRCHAEAPERRLTTPRPVAHKTKQHINTKQTTIKVSCASLFRYSTAKCVCVCVSVCVCVCVFVCVCVCVCLELKFAL